jgi:hypothetical protein
MNRVIQWILWFLVCALTQGLLLVLLAWRLCCKNSQRNTMARRFPVLVVLKQLLQRRER